MELRRYLNVIRQKWLIIVLAMVVALAFAYTTRPTGIRYSSFATIYVGNTRFEQSQLSNDTATGTERVARTFAVMIASEAIAQAAIDETGVQRTPASVARSTVAGVLPGTSLITVAYVDSDPTVARQIANGLADALVERVSSFEPLGPLGEGDTPQLPAYVFERARTPIAPVAANTVGHFIVILAFGLAIAIGIVFVLDYLDLTVRTADDIERRTGLSVLGIVPMCDPEVEVARPGPEIVTSLARPGVASA